VRGTEKAGRYVVTKQRKIGIIGLGKMGEAIALGLKGRFAIEATTRTPESAQGVEKRLGIVCHTDNLRLARDCDVILLGVKPRQAQPVVEALRPVFASRAGGKASRSAERARGAPGARLLISICAAVSTGNLEEWSGGLVPVVRAMPNTPCLIGQGMTVYCLGRGAAAEQAELVESVFGPIGRTARVEESLMDGVTGLSGCGPAYVYLMIEALSEAGVKVGLPRETATLLAAQTLMGSARMVLERGEHPAALKDEVTTPAGCTIDGLMALEEGKLRVTLIKAVLAATRRSEKLRG
jgi:pyrroline-5-carboxylate reductase